MPSSNFSVIEYPVIIAGRVDLLMRDMKAIILLMIFFLTILSRSLTGQSLINWNGSSRAYYISNNGEDDNPGTREQPFKTIDKINELGTISGDTIYFKGGEHFAGTLRLTIKATKFNRALISSYGKGRAIIDGNVNE